MSLPDNVNQDAQSNDEFIKRLMGSVVLATKAANTLPKGSDYQYYSMSKDFSSTATSVQQETRALIQQLCAFAKPETSAGLSEDLTDSALYEHTVDVIDSLLESADQLLDGKKEPALANNVNQTLLLDKDRLLQQTSTSVTTKPQEAFLTQIDNSRSTPFRPCVLKKYHPPQAKLDLTPRRVVLTEDDEGTIGPDTYYPHPYESELRSLEPPSWTGEKAQVVSPTPTYSSLPCTFVDNASTFAAMVKHLGGKTELAVDLEHHSMHSFQGLTCLLQLSTREQDFVVDALALRSQLHELGAFFADPTVVKVLHGCDKDVLWLQRDLGLYLVNVFDTHVAAKVLQYPALSLAHLLKVHCGINADKKHQLSDWRQRALPPEMLHYANEDTRYLLYIYDRLREEVRMKLPAAGLLQVFNASKLLCLVRYERPRFNPLGYRELFRESAVGRAIPKFDDLTVLQESALSALWDWRDRTARAKDESSVAIMSNAELVRIGVHLPKTAVQLEQQCGPLTPTTRANTAEILRLVSEAVSLGPSSASAAHASSSAEAFAAGGGSTPSGKPAVVSGVHSAGKKAAESSGKHVLPDTVYTFTPAVLSPKIVVGRASSADLAHSAQISEVFRDAGWGTPLSKGDRGTSEESPLQFDTYRRPEISQENRALMQNSHEELVRKHNAEFNARLSRLAASPLPPPSHPATASVAATGGASQSISKAGDAAGSKGKTQTVEVAGVAIEIPQSMEEVYSLSQRNRQRNKDKRRAGGGEEGEGDGDSMAMDTAEDGDDALRSSGDKDDDGPFELRSGLDKVAVGGGKRDKGKVDANFYLQASGQATDIGVDSTLEFAQSLGWVRGPAQASAVREAHYQDLSYQQAGEVEEQQQGGAPLRKSGEKSGPGKAGVRGGSAEGIAGMDTSSKAFDYSKVPLAAMSALPTGSGPAKDDRHGGGKDKKRGPKGRGGGGRGDMAPAPSNPYLFGSDQQRK